MSPALAGLSCSRVFAGTLERAKVARQVGREINQVSAMRDENPSERDSPVLLKVIETESAQGNAASLLRLAVVALREKALRSGDGAFLGSEQDLIKWLGVSRPTFRQAARLLEQEQLLFIKKGPGGGYFAKTPDLSAAIHFASICLVAKQGKIDDISRVGMLLFVYAAQAAASLPDVAQREKLRCFVGIEADGLALEDAQHFAQCIEKLSDTLIDLSTNPALDMFMRITRKFSASLRVNMSIDREDRRRCLQLVRRMAEAIIDGDTELARLMSERLSIHIRRWYIDAPE